MEIPRGLYIAAVATAAASVGYAGSYYLHKNPKASTHFNIDKALQQPELKEYIQKIQDYPMKVEEALLRKQNKMKQEFEADKHKIFALHKENIELEQELAQVLKETHSMLQEAEERNYNLHAYPNASIPFDLTKALEEPALKEYIENIAKTQTNKTPNQTRMLQQIEEDKQKLLKVQKENIEIRQELEKVLEDTQFILKDGEENKKKLEQSLEDYEVVFDEEVQRLNKDIEALKNENFSLKNELKELHVNKKHAHKSNDTPKKGKRQGE